MNTLTSIQFETARALASAYGHHWAHVESVIALCAYGSDESVSVAEIDRIAFEALGEGSVGGICSPTTVDARSLSSGAPMEEHFVVVHTTGSHRLWWAVRDDGSVEVAVSRPIADGSVVVMSATIGPQTYWSASDEGRAVDVVVGTHAEARPRARHLSALREALVPLVGLTRSWNVVLPLLGELGVELVLWLEPNATLPAWCLVDLDASDEQSAALRLGGVQCGQLRSLADTFHWLAAVTK